MFFVYKNDPHLDPAFIEYILCKYIIDVYLLKELLGQGGEHTFIGETLKHSHCQFTVGSITCILHA